ncbi:hypothetical protein M885DRAFT_510951 [Pelagophyceae sp. CCMP2097]|nr:hypothetical protein M885DRAFT_510951 [Pelagophyceae sp. CCMP2097]|mmetsp:Transcript_6049/g.19323  ORF Transcript_6049/g.19323 Transcript_6049/m.19323 type:complete len:278 (+) Transcript_6049:63-896(+)
MKALAFSTAACSVGDARAASQEQSQLRLLRGLVSGDAESYSRADAIFTRALDSRTASAEACALMLSGCVDDAAARELLKRAEHCVDAADACAVLLVKSWVNADADATRKAFKDLYYLGCGDACVKPDAVALARKRTAWLRQLAKRQLHENVVELLERYIAADEATGAMCASVARDADASPALEGALQRRGVANAMRAAVSLHKSQRAPPPDRSPPRSPPRARSPPPKIFQHVRPNRLSHEWELEEMNDPTIHECDEDSVVSAPSTRRLVAEENKGDR